ncbi:DUF1805 domain-containing protein [Brevibacillus nitrificans]|uniref:DUF1805 domain-containing protein n=1 Tax=Brevibacillus nitrificans TaxID=651560 RepID=UPI00285C346F|nr:DUF1805 domain-containing protein [Brevibacillus nitrificans]MDR7319624.1 uncharacterized protein YunC (DUF1805 family) [Brevibacillus nitrificans]
MIMMKPIEVEGHQVISIEVALPKTTLLAITTDHGYIMCGALDIRLLNEKLNDRRIVAGRATGVPLAGMLQRLGAHVKTGVQKPEQFGDCRGRCCKL